MRDLLYPLRLHQNRRAQLRWLPHRHQLLYKKNGWQVSFECLEGDVMKTLTGAYTFKEAPGVRGSTEVLLFFSCVLLSRLELSDTQSL